MKIPAVRFVKYSSKRRFGVEMELNKKLPIASLAKIVQSSDEKHQVVTTNHYVGSGPGGGGGDVNNKYWHVKFDRSCGDIPHDGGWEIASYVAKGYKDITRIASVAKALTEGGAEVNQNCAFHIHGEASDFTTEQVATTVALWMKIEYVMSESCPKYRRNNKYCRFLTRRYKIDESKVYTLPVFWNAVRPRDCGNPDRRVTLNSCNYVVSGRRTLEMRMPEGTINSREIKNWIRLFINFLDTCKGAVFPEKITTVGLMETLKILGLHSDEPFFILSKALRDTKMWFLKRIIKHTSRRNIKSEAEDVLWMMQLPEPKSEPVPGVTPEVFFATEKVDDDGLTWEEMSKAAKEMISKKKMELETLTGENLVSYLKRSKEYVGIDGGKDDSCASIYSTTTFN